MNKCISIEDLKALLAERLCDEKLRDVRNHLADCQRCQNQLDELTTIDGLAWTRGAAISGESTLVEVPAHRLERLVHDTTVERDVSELPLPLAKRSFLDEFTAGSEAVTLGPYRIMSEIGRGGMGIVLLAYDAELDRRVAIKVLRPDRDNPASRRRFVREARAAAAIRHDHVVTIHAVVNREDELPYFVMEHVEGMTLRQHIQDEQMIAPNEAARIASELAAGVSAAHKAGLVHRDIKPSNILLDADSGRAKITDFGLVLASEEADRVTQPDVASGTPEYMSPEQLQRPQEVSPSADVYGMGVTLYEMLTGELPFTGTVAAVIRQVLHDDPRLPRRLNDQIPQDLEVICLCALDKDPGKRYQSAAHFANDLLRWQKNEPIVARPVGPIGRAIRWQRRYPALAAVSLALVMSVVFGFVAVVWQWKRAEDNLEISRVHHQQAEDNLKRAIEEEEQRRKKEREALQQQQRATKAEKDLATARGNVLSAVLQTQVRQNPRPTAAVNTFMEHLVGMAEQTRQHVLNDPIKLAGTYLWEANLHRQMNRKQKALAGYEKARDMYLDALENAPHDPQVYQTLASCWRQIGELREQDAIALDCHEKSRAILYDLVEQNPDGFHYLFDLAESHIAIGRLQAALHSDQASQSVDNAIVCLRRTHLATASLPNIELQKDIAIAHRNLAELQIAMDRNDHATASFERSCELLTKLVGPHSKRHDLRLELARTANRYGEHLEQCGEYEKAVNAFEEAIEQHKQVSKINPHLQSDPSQIDKYYANVSRVLFQLGDVDRIVETSLQRSDITPWEPQILYECAENIARAIALVEPSDPTRGDYAAHVKDLLQQAAEVGFQDFNKVAKNSHFKVLNVSFDDWSAFDRYVND